MHGIEIPSRSNTLCKQWGDRAARMRPRNRVNRLIRRNKQPSGTAHSKMEWPLISAAAVSVSLHTVTSKIKREEWAVHGRLIILVSAHRHRSN
jgi:hypothetical protein